jgi:formate dehydrogenase maturation protein FdhE
MSLPQYKYNYKVNDKWMVCRLCDKLVCECWLSYNYSCPKCGDQPNLMLIQSIDDDGYLTCYLCKGEERLVSK